MSSSRKRRNLNLKSGTPKKFVIFSLKDFDINQGQSFTEWEEETILSKLMTRLRELSSLSIQEAITNGIIKVYDDFPPKSDFSHPAFIPAGVKWATIHIRGKERIAGYIDENVFFVVFLDKDHRFWITEKKHT